MDFEEEYGNDPNELFYKELMEYADEYEKLLAEKYKKGTVRDHIIIVNAWCEYICIGIGITGFEEITVSLARSKFYNYYRHHEIGITPAFTYNSIKRFLLFIYETHGIRNEKLLEKLVSKR